MVLLVTVLIGGASYVSAPVRYAGRVEGVISGSQGAETEVGSQRVLQVRLLSGATISVQAPPSMAHRRGDHIVLEHYERSWLIRIDTYTWPLTN